MQGKHDDPLWERGLDTEEKLKRLLEELTLDEKLHMLSSGSGGVERLGIPDCRLGGEAAHGVEARNDQNGVGEADITTSFPQPVGMSSSWDTEAIREAGRIVGKEARLVYRDHPWGGISRWAPTVDLLRDPRWGRNEEAYGEDPLQVGTMAAAYVRGIQGEDREHLMTASTLKHFYANNTELGRGWKNSSISPRNKYELYLEPFRRCIEDGGAEGVMTAYNRVNGVPGLFNEEVQTILKDEFGLTHAVSDGGAMEMTASYTHATGLDAESAARSVKAGVDALSGRPDTVYAAVSEAYELGLLTEEDLDRAIRNVYSTKIRLGLLDEDAKQDALGELCSEEARKACKELTDRSLVLLKNDGILPLKEEAFPDSVLIGPVGDKWYQDWYGGAAPERISLKEGLNELRSSAGNKEPVPYVDACDRIRLKCGEQYLAADEEGRVRLSDKPDTFVLEDWGEASYTLRNEESGKYLSTKLAEDVIEEPYPEKISGKVCMGSERIFSWFDLEVFRLDGVSDGGKKIIMRDRFGKRLYADKDGYIVSAKADHKALARLEFEIETLRNGMEEALSAAKGAGTVILALGHCPMINAKEEVDRATIEFIPYQQRLFDEIRKVNPSVVVVLMSDYPFAINEISENARAILWSATGSQCMGRSLADALTGRAAPAGRLTQTWFRWDKDLPDIDDYDIIGGGRTYRFFEGDVLYPFGYGLTYTSFEYSGLKLSLTHSGNSDKERKTKKRYGQPNGVYDELRKDDRLLEVGLSLRNTGERVSDEVVQIYAKIPKKRLKQLIGFERVKALAPGESREVKLLIPIRELAFYDVIREALIVEKGEYEITAASSSRDPGLSARIDIDGATPGLRDMSKKIKADHYDEESGSQIVEGLYGYSALTAKGDNVYEPSAEGHFSASYAACEISSEAKSLRIHGCAPEDALVRVYIDGLYVGELKLNTRGYEQNPQEARNLMPRALEDERRRKSSYPLLWADIRIPLKLDAVKDLTARCGHEIRIEAEGAFMYDWFMIL
ncbi:MAG: glycoside hydrolase family 3 C-terminal domain-containing protein [Lachnospiraceae bacterium]|nr:glycoside hydrolase family 3 C-terminal domain-containing protein [Lachnospiraceae bacterium]